MPLANATNAPTADSIIAKAQWAGHPILVWYCVASFILFLPFCRVLGLLCRHKRRYPPLSIARPRPRGNISYRRLPAAIIHTFQALAFRWTITIGKSYTLNVTQFFITAAYMATLFTWAFVNCMQLIHFLLLLLLTYRSNVHKRREIGS